MSTLYRCPVGEADDGVGDKGIRRSEGNYDWSNAALPRTHFYRAAIMECWSLRWKICVRVGGVLVSKPSGLENKKNSLHNEGTAFISFIVILKPC